MRKLTCHCEHEFSADIPESVNLDEHPEVVGKIASGSFLTCTCPSCNSILHLDIRTRVEWPSKNAVVVLVPEIERLSLESGQTEREGNESFVVGYAELADRIAVLDAGLDPLAVEFLKYRLLEKSREANPDLMPLLYFERLTDNKDLEFHIHGIRDGEVAVTSVPNRVYSMIRDEIATNPDRDDCLALVNGGYISVRNILVEGDEDDA